MDVDSIGDVIMVVDDSVIVVVVVVVSDEGPHITFKLPFAPP